MSLPDPTPGHPEITCHQVPHLVADGPTQMALDEALLDSVAADPASVLIRTYEWSVPTLSLGYFQRLDEALADPRWRDVPVIRRPTGGGALWHDREVTYAVVVPRSHPLAHPSTALYRTLHDAIAARLRRLGTDARRRDELPTAPGPAADHPFLCFLDRDGSDVVARGAKIVGSAQRRRAGAVLQHGSLLLSRSPATPELPGLVDLAAEDGTGAGARDDSTSGWAATLAEALVEALGGSVVARDWTVAERGRAASLRADQYDNPAWTGRR